MREHPARAAASEQGAAGKGSMVREPVGAFYFPVDAPLMDGNNIAASTIEKAGGKVEVLEGFCSLECEKLLKDFFASRR